MLRTTEYGRKTQKIKKVSEKVSQRGSQGFPKNAPLKKEIHPIMFTEHYKHNCSKYFCNKIDGGIHYVYETT